MSAWAVNKGFARTFDTVVKYIDKIPFDKHSLIGQFPIGTTAKQINLDSSILLTYYASESMCNCECAFQNTGA